GWAEVLVAERIFRLAGVEDETPHHLAIDRHIPEAKGIPDRRAVAVASEVEREDGEALLLQLHGQRVPAFFLAVAAGLVEQDDTGGLLPPLTRIEGALQLDKI